MALTSSSAPLTHMPIIGNPVHVSNAYSIKRRLHASRGRRRCSRQVYWIWRLYRAQGQCMGMNGVRGMYGSGDIMQSMPFTS